MTELRCLFCGKLLCKIQGIYQIEIKCNKCKQIIKLECQERQS